MTDTFKIALAASAALALAAGAASAQGQGQGQGPGGMLTRMDTNGDGSISRAEADAARVAMFNRTDTDHDGFLSQAERDAARQQRGAGGPGGPGGGGGPGGPGGRSGMNNADANNDGRVSRQEFMAQPNRLFERLDTDRNNVISPAEIAAGRSPRD